MVRLTVLAVSSVLALSTVPVKAQPVPVVPVVPAPVYHDHDWRAHERERAYHHEHSTASGRKSAISMPAAGHCMSNVGMRRKTASTAVERVVKRLGLVLS